MYKHTLQVHGEKLAQAQTLPVNTTAAGNGEAQRTGGAMGGLEVVMLANTACGLALGKKLTLTLTDSDDGSTFAAVPVTFAKTFAAAKSFAPGEVMARLPLATDVRKYIKCSMATDDAAATGKVDVIIVRNR